MSAVSGEVTHLREEDLLDDPVPTEREGSSGLGRSRQLTALALALIGLPLLTLGLIQVRDTVSLESVVLIYLLVVVVIAVIGGVLVALPSAFGAAALINWYFIEPLHSLNIGRGEQLLALGVFLVVAGAVSGAVELAERRARSAARAAEQAETLLELTRTKLDDSASLHGVLERAREEFGMESVALKARDRFTDTWEDAERAEVSAGGESAPPRFDVAAGSDLRLVGRGPALFAEDQRVLHAFAAAARTAYEGRRLGDRAREAHELAAVDRQRTALLAAVGHDLRTPLAGIKAAVGGLRDDSVRFSEAERAELLETIEESADRLDSVLSNLLDASRLQAGELSVRPEAVAVDQVVGNALLALPDVAPYVRIRVPDETPLLLADPGLLERVLVNLLDNAYRHAGDSGTIDIVATPLTGAVKLEIIDHGPGVAPAERERIFAPFRRLDDHRSVEGVGLGLAVARGFVEAMGGALVPDESPGGGLTMRLRLPRA